MWFNSGLNVYQNIQYFPKTINSKALADATVRETPIQKLPQNNNTNYWSNIVDTTYAETMDSFESIIY